MKSEKVKSAACYNYFYFCASSAFVDARGLTPCLSPRASFRARARRRRFGASMPNKTRLRRARRRLARNIRRPIITLARRFSESRASIPRACPRLTIPETLFATARPSPRDPARVERRIGFFESPASPARRTRSTTRRSTPMPPPRRRPTRRVARPRTLPTSFERHRCPDTLRPGLSAVRRRPSVGVP